MHEVVLCILILLVCMILTVDLLLVVLSRMLKYKV